MTEKDYLNRIKEEKEHYYIRSHTKTYINKEYNVYDLMNLDIPSDRKIILYQTIIENLFEPSFYYHIKEEKDRILFLKAFCNVNPQYESNYYRMLSEISDPVNVFSNNELKIITKYIRIYGWQDLEETIGFDKAASIINVLVPLNYVFQSAEVIKYIYDDNRKIIYESACDSLIYFKHICDKTDEKYKDELLNYYISNKKNDYEISEYIIKNKLIKDDISVIENTTSTIIYSYLIRA